MKILFTQETDWIKRNAIIQHHLLEILSLRGHEIRVIDFEIDWAKRKHGLFSKRQVFKNPIRVYDNAKITLIRPGIIKIPILDYVSVLFSHKREIERQIKDWSPDIIIGVAILNSWWAARDSKKADIPFIYYWFELMHLLIPIRPLQYLGRLIEKSTLENTDEVLATTDSLKKAVIKLGANKDHARVLRMGVDLSLYNLNGTGDFIRQQYGIKKEDTVLFFMGYLYHFSGLKEVCIQLSKANNPNIKFLIVGNGDAYEELKELRDTLYLTDQVILTGHKSFAEIPSYLAAADICLLPAYNNEIMKDIAPGKIYEYMAAGKPVISTNLPGIINEFGLDNGIIYVNRPEDVLLKAVEMINAGISKDIGLIAKKYIEKYSWNSIADEFEGILQKAIDEKLATK